MTSRPTGAAAPPYQPPPPSSYSQTHPHPNLHIKIAPPTLPKVEVIAATPTPRELSYPSPPLSLDSPPSAQPDGWITNRRGMATGGVSSQPMSAEPRRTAIVAQ